MLVRGILLCLDLRGAKADLGARKISATLKTAVGRKAWEGAHWENLTTAKDLEKFYDLFLGKTCNKWVPANCLRDRTRCWGLTCNILGSFSESQA